MASVLAAVFPAPNAPVEFREFPEPELEPGAALLHTLFSEVCGTDVHLHRGRLSGVPYPIIPGHVSAGVKPWAEMAGGVYELRDVASALAAVADRSAVKAVVRVNAPPATRGH